MPPLPPVFKVIKLEHLGTNNGVPWANITHWSFPGTNPTETQMQAWVGTAHTNFAANMVTYANTEVKYTETIGTDLTGPTGAQATASTVYTGGLSAHPLPAQVAVLINHTILRRYRGGKPRQYVVQGDYTMLADDNHWTNTLVTGVQTAWTGYIAQQNLNTWTGGGTPQFVSVSYVSGGARRVTPVVDPILVSTVDNRVATIRRRDGRKRA